MAKLRVGEFKINEPEEMPRVREAIRRALGKSDLFLSHRVRGPVLDVMLTGARAMQFPEDEVGGIVPFVTVGDWRYWLSVLLEFRVSMGEAHFRSASLTIWRSALVTEDPTRVLRAEWELVEVQQNRVHAQPHWHVYLAEWERGLSHSATRSMERFHLAMATGWHLEEEIDSHYRAPSPSGVAGWIRQCLVYTRSQLESISRRN